jgi:hypothetical protein
MNGKVVRIMNKVIPIVLQNELKAILLITMVNADANSQ